MMMCSRTVSSFFPSLADAFLTSSYLDNPDEVDRAPCAIQIVAPRFQDEKCLAAAEIIDRALGDSYGSTSGDLQSLTVLN